MAKKSRKMQINIDKMWLNAVAFGSTANYIGRGFVSYKKKNVETESGRILHIQSFFGN
jgi:hypothetical protein